MILQNPFVDDRTLQIIERQSQTFVSNIAGAKNDVRPLETAAPPEDHFEEATPLQDMRRLSREQATPHEIKLKAEDFLKRKIEETRALMFKKESAINRAMDAGEYDIATIESQRLQRLHVVMDGLMKNAHAAGINLETIEGKFDAASDSDNEVMAAPVQRDMAGGVVRDINPEKSPQAQKMERRRQAENGIIQAPLNTLHRGNARQMGQAIDAWLESYRRPSAASVKLDEKIFESLSDLKKNDGPSLDY